MYAWMIGEIAEISDGYIRCPISERVGAETFTKCLVLSLA